MKHGRSQFAGNFEHVRDHEQQTLARREGRGQRSGLQGAMHRTGGSAFGLHLNDTGNGAPDVSLSHGAFHVGDFAHYRRGSNGVDGNDLVGGMRHMGSRGIAVDGYHFTTHTFLLWFLYKRDTCFGLSMCRSKLRTACDCTLHCRHINIFKVTAERNPVCKTGNPDS